MHKAICSFIGGLASVVMLGGCVLPAAQSIASLGFDGASYAATGKSVQDNAISVVADEDCALWRAVVGRSVCVEKSEMKVASLPIQQPVHGRDDAPSNARRGGAAMTDSATDMDEQSSAMADSGQ
jgi:hypothetical protein